MIRTLMIFLTLIIFIPIANAEEDKPTCKMSEKDIRKDILVLGECWNDSDCKLKNFGCPWQKRLCHFSIVSTEDIAAIKDIEEKIYEYTTKCIDPDVKLAKQCRKYNEASVKSTCKGPQLYCVSGQCVTKTHILIKAQEKGKDPYGSKAILGED